MEQNTNCRRQDAVINFKDLGIHLIKHFKIIIACTLALTVFAAGFKYVKDMRAVGKSSDTAVSSDAVSAAESGLTELQKDNARAAAAAKIAVSKQAKHIKLSPLFAIDTENAYSQKLVYTVNGNGSEEAAAMLKEVVYSSDLYNKAHSAADLKGIEAQYLSDIIITDIYDAKLNPKTEDTATTLTVNVFGTTEKASKAIAEIVKQAFTEKAEKIKQVDGRFVCTLVSEETVFGNSEILRDMQADEIRTFNDLTYYHDEIVKRLDDSEKSLYELLVSDINAGSETDEPRKVSVSKKYLVFGFGAGFVGSVLVLVLVYLFSQKVKSADDVKCRFNEYVFGSLYTETAGRKGSRGTVKHFYNKDGQSGVISKEAALAAQEHGAKSVLIITENADEKESNISAICDAMKQKDIKASVALTPYKNADTLDAVTQSDAVILVPTAGITTYDSLYHQQQLCEKYGKNVLGIIVLQ